MSLSLRLLRGRRLLFTAAIAITALVVAAIVVFTRSPQNDDRELVAVAEQGFSIVRERHLTYAFVVENRSTERALEGARYEARFFDAKGTLLAERQGPMPVVLPGAKAAIAEESIEVSAIPTVMSVLIAGGDMRLAKDLPPLQPGNIRGGHSPGLGGGKADATTELWNPYAVELTEVYVASVYRNADRAIIGGSSKVIARLHAGKQEETIALENGPGATQVLQDGTRISFPARPVFYPSPMGPLANLKAAYEAGKRRPAPAPPMVRWVPAEPPVYKGPEEAFPFTPAGTPASMVYVVEGDSEPRLLYESGRRLYRPDWRAEDDDLSFGFSSRKVDPPAEARGPFYSPYLNGTLGLAFFGEQVWEVMTEAPQALAPSPQGQRIAFQPSGSEIYVFYRDGTSVRLEGLGDRMAFVGWSAGGDWMVVFSYEQVVSPVPADGYLYIVDLADGPAIRLEPPASHTQRETASLSPVGNMVAFVAGMTYDTDGWRAKGDVYVYEISAGETRRLTTDRGYGSTRPAWSADGRLLAIDGDLIDAYSGLITSLVEPPAYTMGAVISPDERYMVGTEQPYIDGPAGCPAGVLQNRTHVYDRVSGQSRTVLDCQDGYYIVRTWDYAWGRAERWLAGGRELIIATTPIYCCHTSTNKLSILNVETGAIRTLFEREEGKLNAIASPDGTLILVTGGGLHIFSADGTLLRTIEVPPGYEVQSAIWSPDCSRIAYILVPEGLFEGV